MTEPAAESVTGRSGLTRQAAAYGLVLMTLLNFVNYIDRTILAAVLPKVGADLHLTDDKLGLLGGAFLFSYMCTSPIFGQLATRFSRTRLMAAGVAVWSLATAGGGLARSFGQMFAARATVGVGEASYATISPTLLSDYYPKNRRGRVFSIFFLATPVGTAVGYLLGGFLEAHFGWRTAFFAVGLPGVLLALLTLSAPDPPRGINDDPSEPVERQPFGATLRALAANRVYVLTVLGFTAYTFALGGMIIWAPTYFNRERGLDLVWANMLIGGISVAAGIGGTFVGGYLSDLLSARIRQAYLYVSGVSMLLAIPLAWVGLSATTPAVYIGALFAAEFFVFLSTGPINVVLVSVVPVAMRAMAMAVSIFVIHLLGDAISPYILGVVSVRSSLSTAVLIMPVAIAVSGLIWTYTAWSASRAESRL
jgi:MFS transporter, Spinster family, sphingosine-1-phosphate transporter